MQGQNLLNINKVMEFMTKESGLRVEVYSQEIQGLPPFTITHNTRDNIVNIVFTQHIDFNSKKSDYHVPDNEHNKELFSLYDQVFDIRGPTRCIELFS